MRYCKHAGRERLALSALRKELMTCSVFVQGIQSKHSIQHAMEKTNNREAIQL
jgi:hypothetical protein